MPLLLTFSLFVLLLIGSKSQHALWGLLPALVPFLSTWKEKRPATRVVGAALGILLLVASIVVVRLPPPYYHSQALFNLIFLKLAKESADPARDLQALGLSTQDMPYIGLWAFQPQAPASDPKWLADFGQRTNYFKVAKFYLHQPLRAWRILNGDLLESAPRMRLFADLRRQDAHKPNELARNFASWSNLRSTLFLRWPHHILVWYTLLGTFIVLILRARPSVAAVRLAWITAALSGAAGIEYGVSSLADACETFRHLFLFHALTDLTVCMALSALLSGTLRTLLTSARIRRPA